MLVRTALFCILALVLAVCPAVAMEFLHFWRTPGEAAALDVLRQSYIREGGVWYDEASTNKAALRERLVQRLAEGLPPTAFQWHGGAEIETFLSLGVIRPAHEVADVSDHNGRLLETVGPSVRVNGRLAVIPLGVHVENRAWFNAAIYRELGLDYPARWPEFLAQAETILAAGYAPIAVGDEGWQKALLFGTILTGVGGFDLQRHLAAGTTDRADVRAGIREAVATLLAIRDLVDSSGQKMPGNWRDTALRVAQQRAAMQVMGGWVRPELRLLGLEAGADFACRQAPGNAASLALAIDVLALTPVEDAAARASQTALVQSVLSDRVLLDFARAKGSLPPVDMTLPGDADPCMQGTWALLQNPASDVLVTIDAYPEDRLSAYIVAIEAIWADRAMTVDAAVIRMLAAFGA